MLPYAHSQNPIHTLLLSYNRRSLIALYCVYIQAFLKTRRLHSGTLHSISAIPHRLMLFFLCRITRKYNFGLRGITAVARRRIADNTFSLSRELGLLCLLRPGTEAIKLYSQRNQLCEKKKKKRAREEASEARREKGQTGKADTICVTVKFVDLVRLP